MKSNYLVVAASGQVRDALGRELTAKGHSVTLATSGTEAARVAASVAVDVALIESHLPEMTAEEVRQRVIQARPECRVVILTNFDQVRNSPEQLRFGADDYLMRVEEVLALIRTVESPGGGLSHASRQAPNALIQVIDVLVGLIELDDRYFAASAHQSMQLVRAVTEELAADTASVQEVVIATLLRDVGKAGVDPEVLEEEGTYSEDQMSQMQDHVRSSLRLFEHIRFPWKILPVIRNHHERYDGSGYPDGLRGRAIPMGSRIIAVVDAYVAMTSARSHREALEPAAALKELIRQAGHQFDPEVVEAFQRVLDRRLRWRRSDNKRRVLIIEPTDDFRKLLKMRLLNEGYEIAESPETESGLELILKNPPDLVLADVDDAPDTTFQFMHKMRADDNLRRVPVMLMSRRTDRVLKLRALREGVDDFISKDDDLAEIVARVGNVIAREAMRREGTARARPSGICGDLADLSLPDIVQTLVIGMKTACVTITCEKRTGRVWFENGAPRHAQVGRRAGEKSFYEMLRWKNGQFSIEHGLTSKKNTLKQDAMFLLMEGLRQMDELAETAAQSAVP